ncbi:MAG TPA: hypothetical protein VG125_09965 [Pirellulales bacterium]|nr:hypothetical protein [Pirellulales bacterium]
MRCTTVGFCWLLCVGLIADKATSGATPGESSPEALQAEIDSLKAPKVAWREIAWTSCLLDGLRESRIKNKPALLWVFIDRPVDDARC